MATTLFRTVEADYQLELEDVLEFIKEATPEEKSEIIAALGVEAQSNRNTFHFYDELVSRFLQKAATKFSLVELEERLA